MEEKPSKPRAYVYIRWSSAKQDNGDSRRRQELGVEEFTKRTGVDITETFRDEGISGFNGQNLKLGALKDLMERVRNGIIRKGDYIVVESVDRLTRMNVWKAIEILGNIMRAGVRIYTTNDQKLYDDYEGDTFSNFLYLSMIAQRAWEESEQKRKRLKAVWEQKRKTIIQTKEQGKLLTSAVPVWLEVRKDDQGKQYFHIKEDIVADIKTLLELLKTRGYRASLRVFNERYRKSDFHFREVYLSKLLTDGRLYGNLTLKERYYDDNGKVKHRVIETIPDYYPKVVDFGVVEETRIAVKSRDFTMSGQYTTGSIENIFKHILKCGACGGALSIKTNTKYYKGKPHKVYYYLECKNHRIGSCFQRNLNLTAFENAFIQYFELFKLEHILNESLDAEVLDVEKAYYDSKEIYFKTKSEQDSIEKMLSNYIDKGIDVPDTFMDKSLDVAKRLQEHKKEMETIGADLAFKKQQSQKKYALEDIKQALDDGEKRLALNQYLKIQKIKIYARIIGDLVFVVFDNIKTNPFYEEVLKDDTFPTRYITHYMERMSFPEYDGYGFDFDPNEAIDQENFDKFVNEYSESLQNRFIQEVIKRYEESLKNCSQVVYIYDKELNSNTDEHRERLGRLFKDPLFEAQRYYIEFLDKFDERSGCEPLIEIKGKIKQVDILSLCEQVYKEMEGEIMEYHQTGAASNIS